MFEDIRVDVTDAIGTVTLIRAEQRNTLRPSTMRELCVAFDQLTADPECAVLLLRAEGKHFSAGADFAFLDELTRTPPAAIRAQVYEHFQGAVRRLYRCPKPTLALIQGACVTVGCELVLAADFRIAADDAFFQESWIKLGIMPPLGGTFLLPRLIGAARASDMVLRGTAVKAADAVRYGLTNDIVPRDDLDRAGLSLAEELKAAPPLAYRAAKEALHRGYEASMDAEWAANVSAQAVLLSSDDFREGLAAVVEKRSARFEGR